MTWANRSGHAGSGREWAVGSRDDDGTRAVGRTCGRAIGRSGRQSGVGRAFEPPIHFTPYPAGHFSLANIPSEPGTRHCMNARTPIRRPRVASKAILRSGRPGAMIGPAWTAEGSIILHPFFFRQTHSRTNATAPAMSAPPNPGMNPFPTVLELSTVMFLRATSE